MPTHHDIALSSYTTLGLGGPAATMVSAYAEAEVLEAMRATSSDVLVLGGGSNVVITDEGYPGTVVRIASQGRSATRVDGAVLLEVAAGENWQDLVSGCVDDGLAGIECLAGIPGLVGATPIQNVGAYGQDVSQTVAEVRAYDRRDDVVVSLDDCGFGYRWSRFKADPERWVVLAVTYRLFPELRSRPIRYAELARTLGVEVGGTAPLADVRDAVLHLRRAKGMVLDPADPDTRSAGSFFTNPILDAEAWAALQARGADPPSYPESSGPGGRVKVPAAWLIEQAGFGKGYGQGAVGVSSKHSLALVNRGGATTADLLRVAREIRDGVRARFGVELVPEPVLVGCSL